MQETVQAEYTRRSPSYVIWRTPGAGFFSIVASTLARFHLAEQSEAVPVVDLESPSSVYQEIEPINGTRNVWEYYFDQPGPRSLSEVEETALTNDGAWPKGYPYDLSGSPVYHEMWNKYVVLNSVTAEFISRSRKDTGISPKSLAVHFRGQEMRTAKGHRYPPTINQVHKAIEWSLENYDFDEIFLVTEAQQYVDAFSKKWGKRINPSPSFRLRHKNSYTLSPPPRSRHRYLLGLEALRDAVLMGECAGLICGRSNLSEAAIMLAAGAHQPLVKISQGRNSFRPYISPLKWYFKASLPGILGGFKKWAPPA